MHICMYVCVYIRRLEDILFYLCVLVMRCVPSGVTKSSPTRSNASVSPDLAVKVISSAPASSCTAMVLPFCVFLGGRLIWVNVFSGRW